MCNINHFSRSQIEEFINELIIGLNAGRNRKIIRDKFFEGLTIPQIAEKYDLSETRVKTVIRTFRHSIDKNMV